jgi:hypothetical protein
MSLLLRHARQIARFETSPLKDSNRLFGFRCSLGALARISSAKSSELIWVPLMLLAMAIGLPWCVLRSRTMSSLTGPRTTVCRIWNRLHAPPQGKALRSKSSMTTRPSRSSSDRDASSLLEGAGLSYRLLPPSCRSSGRSRVGCASDKAHTHCHV